MKNKTDERKTYILTSLICLLPIIAGLILLPRLPDEIVTHWAFDGTPNGWSHKLTAVLVLPGILLLVNLTLPLIMKTDPRYSDMNPRIRSLIQWIIPIVCVFCSGTTLANALGIPVNIRILCPMFLGLIFVIIGNYLPKTPRSYTVGIKLPWTLHDEENWNKTHRLAGFVWIIGGLLIMASAFIPGNIGRVCMSLAIVCMLAIPTVYSYLYYRKTAQ